MYDFNYITPEDAAKMGIHKGKHDLEYYRKLNNERGRCQCGHPIWKLAGTGACFTCTTGETDASDEYELR